MTEDDRSKRKPGAKSVGNRERRPGAGKPAGKGFAKRPDGEFRPKRKFDAAGRSDEPGKSGGRERPKRDFDRDDRPKRDFRRSERPQQAEAGAERPFRKGPRPEGKPFRKREGDDRQFRSRDGEGRQAERGDRPQRDFRQDRGPREGRPREDGDSPRGESRFGKGPRPGGKPFAKREDGDRAFAPRTERGFAPRKDERGERPKRDFAGSGKPAGQFKPRPRPAAAEQQDGERIAKRLARAGIASRRDAEELIAAGRVRVNGVVLESPAFNVQPNDVILVDGVEIPPIERTRLFLFHKPAGVVTTNRDPEGRKTVFDVLPADLPRLMTVGRLDINTEGLLLLTNDGGLARVLELPATGWLRRYRVRVHGKVDEQALADLKNGIAVDGIFYGGAEASLERVQGTNAWVNIGLREGKNREVRNILGALGLEVTRLIRISYGPFQLGELPEGHVLEIKGRTLREQLGERLIEESGANFDADIARPFSNKPVRQQPRSDDDAPESRTPARKSSRLDIGEGGLIKRRKMRENSRDEALGKLSTRPKPGFGGKPARKDDGGREGLRKKERPPLDPPGQRKANVWMAPGARPVREREAGTEKRDASPPRKPTGRSGPRGVTGKGPKRS
jgi:23S rRNA pseudouridine2605 synthase